MKTIFFYLIALIAPSIFAQAYTGEVIYKKILIGLKDEKSHSGNNRLMNSVASSAEALNYVLVFNSEASSFQVEDAVLNDSNLYQSRALSIGGGSGTYYTEAGTKRTLHEIDYFGKKYIIVLPDSKLDWKVTKQAKKIGNYTAYKAIASIQVDMSLFKEIKSKVLNFEAWFTPEIPVSYGPREINSLPGLVLETTIGGVMYRAISVNFNPSGKLPEIVPPNKGEFITEEELDVVAKKMMEKIRN